MIEELKKIEKYIHGLVKENERLKQNIGLIFSEEEVQGLPSYKLFRETYGEDAITTVGHTVTTKTTYVDNQFDSIYAPPTHRGKTRVKSIPEEATGAKKPVVISKKPAATPRQIEKTDEDLELDADLRDALFDDEPKQMNIKQDVDTIHPPDATDAVTITPVGDSLAAEFNGVKYIINNQKIYLASTGRRVGEINDHIIIDGQPLALEEKQLQHCCEQYYTTPADEYVYCKFNENIGYRIGEIKGDDLCAWS